MQTNHSITFTVPGAPVPKGRPRTGARGNTYTPDSTRTYEAVVASHALAAVRRWNWPMRYEGPLKVSLSFVMPNRRRVDCDNLCKGVLDSLNRLLYADDSQSLEMHAYKSVDADAPRVEVRVDSMPEEVQ